jgi:hypothetical protein
MKRKYFFVVLFLILAIFLSGCGGITNILSANVTIDSWGQISQRDIKIVYTVENTGNITIGYYEVYFKVACNDGSVYQDWDFNIIVKVGEKETNYFHILVPSGKEVISVYINDYYLANYL